MWMDGWMDGRISSVLDLLVFQPDARCRRFFVIGTRIQEDIRDVLYFVWWMHFHVSEFDIVYNRHARTLTTPSSQSLSYSVPRETESCVWICKIIYYIISILPRKN